MNLVIVMKLKHVCNFYKKNMLLKHLWKQKLKDRN
jgi:hypothetical protein